MKNGNNRFYAFIHPMKRKRRTIARADLHIYRADGTQPQTQKFRAWQLEKRKLPVKTYGMRVMESLLAVAALLIFGLIVAAVVLALLALLLHGVPIAR